MTSDRPVSVCLVYFRSLTLAHLDAALHALRRQAFERVAEVVILDNNTEDSPESIRGVVDAGLWPVPVRIVSYKHGDGQKAHAWSTNTVVRLAQSSWVMVSRADYLLADDAVAMMTASALSSDRCFATGRVYHLAVDLGTCEREAWRSVGASALRGLRGKEETYEAIDSGVWCLSRTAFDQVGGLDERLTAWGHAQTHFQYKLYQAGVTFACVPRVLFYHPWHQADRNMRQAHRQLSAIGLNAAELWTRYDGPNPYRI